MFVLLALLACASTPHVDEADAADIADGGGCGVTHGSAIVECGDGPIDVEVGPRWQGYSCTGMYDGDTAEIDTTPATCRMLATEALTAIGGVITVDLTGVSAPGGCEIRIYW